MTDDHQTAAASGDSAGSVVASFVWEQVLAGIARPPEGAREDSYVLSLRVQDDDDDHRRPTVIVSVNTEAQVKLALQRERPTASSAEEARWNFAFWLQTPLVVVGGRWDPRPHGACIWDPAGADLIEAWFRHLGLWYPEFDASDQVLANGQEMTRRFVDVCLSTARRLHESGVIVATFGRPVPVLVHELEYYDGIADQNLAANPSDVVAPFVEWVRRLGA